jgi:phage-related protein
MRGTQSACSDAHRWHRTCTANGMFRRRRESNEQAEDCNQLLHQGSTSDASPMAVNSQRSEGNHRQSLASSDISLDNVIGAWPNLYQDVRDLVGGTLPPTRVV